MKEYLKRLRARLWLRHALLAAAVLGSALVALICSQAGVLNGLERQSVDARFAIRGARGPDKRIVIVALDQQSANAIGVRPPIPRRYWADLFDRIHAAHPRLIAVDSVFGGRTDTFDDQRLLSAIAHDGPIVLGTEQDAGGSVEWPAAVPHLPKGAALATIAVDSDSDAVLRRMLYTPIQLPTLAVRAAQILGRPVSPADFPDNHAWVDFRGPPETFKPIRFINVLRGRVSSSVFDGKIVLVGVTDPLQKDVFVTAVSSVPMSGVEFHANALSTILDRFPLQSLSPALEILLIFALAALPALVSLRFTVLRTYGALNVLDSASPVVLGASAVALVAFLIAVQLAFDSGTIVDVPDLILALVLGTITTFAAEAHVQRRQLYNLQEFFGRLRSGFFISYRHALSESVANTLEDWLTRKFPKESVFRDGGPGGIEPGERFPERIEEEIASCSAMLVLIGPRDEWTELRAADGSRRIDDLDDWVHREIAAGLARRDLAVVPVLHDHAEPPGRAALPDAIKELADCHAVYFTGSNAEAWINELRERIRRGQVRHSQREHPPMTATVGGERPPTG